MAYGGARLGEALAMRAKNLNVAQMAYHVAERYKVQRFKKPKFGKIRIVDLPDFLIDELKEYLRYCLKRNLKQGMGASVDLLFVDPNEKGLWPYSQRKVQGFIRKVCRVAGLALPIRTIFATPMPLCFWWPIKARAMFKNSWATPRFPF